MTAYPSWTPAPRPGIIPLQPLSFGIILGRSFAALRQNPKVLLGFALVVQTLAVLVTTAGVVAVGFATFGRLASLRPGTDEFETVLAGSIAISGVTALVLSLAAGALGVIVQGIVVSEVAQAVVAEKHTLSTLWSRVKPVAWRLIGYTALVSLIVAVVLGILATGIVLLALSAAPLAIALTILLVLSAIPLSLWLSTKLLLVTSAIVLERATILGAIGRSWRLTRGRFWPTLGIVVVISLTFSVLAQVVSIPFSFVTMGLTAVITPTGDPEPGEIIALLAGSLLAQAFVTLIQTIAVIVQSTAGALVYVDCRMRREGLDLDLSSYVDRRDAGQSDLPDPYRQHVGRDLAVRWQQPVAQPGGYGAPPAYPAPGGYASPVPSGDGSPAPGEPTPTAPGPDAPASEGTAPTRPAATEWTAPGSDRA
ncbi:glycerophosphoryl diester phosphodiesterase membrane domain-containing protein [Microbacterium oleivorans]|uniref:Glycerophosphoryl diester phosphodiesterase membrane domain-containing protein n=1 Tax=Microbacterium oleivorans TaxID=273677 RepID=A0A7D5ET73_9MICO|nr:glycerophosphoryl diester phosphodiesterase membrane domain-containing protein [Microbacterium oleivorans]QLD12585.1 glycerophosphoryl diester phosphodiesterase membrane domain-containing protein [Microbacterium oleivorans]